MAFLIAAPANGRDDGLHNAFAERDAI